MNCSTLATVYPLAAEGAYRSLAGPPNHLGSRGAAMRSGAAWHGPTRAGRETLLARDRHANDQRRVQVKLTGKTAVKLVDSVDQSVISAGAP